MLFIFVVVLFLVSLKKLCRVWFSDKVVAVLFQCTINASWWDEVMFALFVVVVIDLTFWNCFWCKLYRFYSPKSKRIYKAWTQASYDFQHIASIHVYLLIIKPFSSPNQTSGHVTSLRTQKNSAHSCKPLWHRQ